MWKELNKDEEIEVLNRYADLRNKFDCKDTFCYKNLRASIIEKTDCHYFVYEDDIYTILIGFKYNHITLKYTYIAYAIEGFGDIEYYVKAFDIIGKKTYEYLKENNQVLEQNIDEMGIKHKIAEYLGGIESFLEMVKVGAEKNSITMNIYYDKNYFEMLL